MGNYPAVKLSIFFSVGILIGHLLNTFSTECKIAIGFAILIIVIAVLLKGSRKGKRVNFIFLLILAAGFFYSKFRTKDISYPFDNLKIKNSEITGEILGIDLLKEDRITFDLKLLIADEHNFYTADHKFISNIWHDSSFNLSNVYQRLKIGNKISFVGNIIPPRNQRNPGEFNFEKYLNSRGICGSINSYKPETLEIIDENTDLVLNAIFEVRRSIAANIDALHSEDAASFLRGIILADRSGIESEIKTSFIKSGVIHVLAVSGLHVGFVSLIFYLILGRFDIRIKYALTIAGIVIFLLITGGHASVFRASTMAIIFLAAKLTNRATNGFNSIAIAALIILILDPNELFDPGFQLSFSAVLSILIIYPILSEKIQNVKQVPFIKKIILFIFVSLSAQLGTLPFTIFYFNSLSLVSLFTNLIVIPLIGIILLIGFITLFISSFSFGIAEIFASANNLLILLMYFFVHGVSELSISNLMIFNFDFYDMIIFYLMLALIIYMLRNFQNKFVLILSMILLIITSYNLSVLNNSSLLKNDFLSVFTVDVGQGDAIIIRFPDNSYALIDAGNCTEYFDNGDKVIIPLLNRLGIERINYGFISHLDSDHVGGFLSLVEKGIIDTAYIPFSPYSAKDIRFEEYLKKQKIIVKHYDSSKMMIGNCRAYFLNDTANFSYKNFDSNNKSGIIKIVYGNNSFLFTGDAEFHAENLLIQKYGDFLKSDVLKVGHHGSKSGTSDEFLDIVDPDYAIISAGRFNRFNHPSDKVLERLSVRNIKTLRTDIEGAVILYSDGNMIRNIDWRKI